MASVSRGSRGVLTLQSNNKAKLKQPVIAEKTRTMLEKTTPLRTTRFPPINYLETLIEPVRISYTLHRKGSWILDQ